MENNELDERSIILKDEAGEEIEFEFLAAIDYLGKQYVVLLPKDETAVEEDGEVVILQRDDVEGTDDSDEFESYISIEDEDTLNAVFDLFKEQYKDEFDFVD